MFIRNRGAEEKTPPGSRGFMSVKRTKGRDARKSTAAVSRKAVVLSKNVTRIGRGAAPKLAAKTTLKSPAKAAINVAVKPDTKTVTRPAIKVAAAKVALKEATPLKPALKAERIHSHPTMCLHCHLIVEMFHERGADPVKGAWQCPRCGHKYLFSHWKIKKQSRGKSEAA
jgi:DNA-directed RNA polymerase subunit RPC12/RpoP